MTASSRINSIEKMSLFYLFIIITHTNFVTLPLHLSYSRTLFFCLFFSFFIILSPFLFTDSLLSNEANNDSTTDESDAQAGGGESSGGVQKINFQPSVSRRNANRYALSFHRETVKEMKAQKDAARKPIQFILRSDLETGDEYFRGYDFPIRPQWSYDMSKEAVDRNENRYFTVEYFNIMLKRIERLASQLLHAKNNNVSLSLSLTCLYMYVCHLCYAAVMRRAWVESLTSIRYYRCCYCCHRHFFFSLLFFVDCVNWFLFILNLATFYSTGLCYETREESCRTRKNVELL